MLKSLFLNHIYFLLLYLCRPGTFFQRQTTVSLLYITGLLIWFSKVMLSSNTCGELFIQHRCVCREWQAHIWTKKIYHEKNKIIFVDRDVCEFCITSLHFLTTQNFRTSCYIVPSNYPLVVRTDTKRNNQSGSSSRVQNRLVMLSTILKSRHGSPVAS